MRLRGLHYRQSCPGGAYYVCQNGFKGCCSIDPCNPGATCPDSNGVTSSSTTTGKSASTSTPVVQSTSTQTGSSSSTLAQASVLTTMASPSTTSPTSILPTATSLTCPAANMTTYIDPNKVQYSIRCNMDNSYASFNSTTVSSGGFSKCFPACDNLSACQGFTFVGTDSGMCYLKSNLPSDGYSSTAGSNYVTVALMSRNAQVDPPSDALPTDPANSSTNSKNAPIGAIVGGVVGGLAFLIILALLVIFCLRRRRKKREEIELATQKPPQGPLEPYPKDDSPFAALGGFYRGKAADVAAPKQASFDESQLAREDSANSFVAVKHDSPPPATSMPKGPAEVEGRPIYPSASVGPVPVEMDASPIMAPKTPMSPQVDESPVLGRYASTTYNSHGQSSLADEVRRRQHSRHIMSWNNYDERSVISPPASFTMSPRIGSPDVSPMLNSSRDSTTSKSPPTQFQGRFI